MNLLRKTLFALLSISMGVTSWAKPAKPGFQVVNQPDGTTLRVQIIGNQRIHFTLTDDNKLVMRDADGIYRYANISDDGAIFPTDIQAHSADLRSATEANVAIDFNDVNISDLKNRRALAYSAHRSNSVSGVGRSSSKLPTTGDVHGLIILVNFADLSFKDDENYNTNAKDYFTNMVSQEGFSEWNGTGSCKEYFEKMSNGLFRPTFDVVGPYTVSKSYAYYGENDKWGWDKYPAKMVAEACKLADDDVNFADYDNDGDGYCDYVYVIYAGPGESSNSGDDYIWPHSYYLSYTRDQVKLDGVTIDSYACSNEWEGTNPDGMGTFAHEFSHVMGLPDIYYTGSSSWLYCTPGSYDALDVGCYNNNSRTIPAYSAYERNALGWIDLKELSTAENISLGHIEETNEACLIRTTNDNEFYLLENRQQSGWDKYIPHHGMLIWHIDFNQKIYDNNNVNNDEDHQYVDIVEANGNPNNSSNVAKKGWPWPGIKGKTEFSATSSPAMIDWSGNAIDMPITDISENNGIISFKVKGGDDSGVNDFIATSNSSSHKQYFNLMGQPVSGNTPGIYIVRDGKSTSKLLIK